MRRPSNSYDNQHNKDEEEVTANETEHGAIREIVREHQIERSRDPSVPAQPMSYNL